MRTSGILSFDDCERALRPDMRKNFLRYLPRKEKEQFCVILLSEIPLDMKYGFDDFEMVPISTKSEPLKPYGFLLYVPKGLDYFTAPLFAEAFASLLSFSLRRRVKAHRNAYSAKNPPKNIDDFASIRLASVSIGPEMSLQVQLSGEEQSKRLEISSRIYEKLIRMDKKEYLSTLRALHLYQLSLLTYREDIGLAYTLLVASIESVAKHFPELEFDFDDLPDTEEWKRFLDKLEISGTQATEIKNKLAKKATLLGLRFRKFVRKWLPDSFWASPDSRAKEFDDYISELRKTHSKIEPEHRNHFETYWWLYTPERKVTKEELDGVLKDIYNLRSKFAHSGVSPPFEVTNGYETAEIKAQIDGKGHIRYYRAIPSYWWFERVVYESIANMLGVL